MTMFCFVTSGTILPINLPTDQRRVNRITFRCIAQESGSRLSIAKGIKPNVVCK
jgi:hypothetical protein